MVITEKEIQFLVNATKLRNSENGLRRIPIEAENRVCELIVQGKYNEIHLRPFSEIFPGMSTLANEPLTQATYLVVASISVWVRKAIEGGAIPNDAYDLSDALLFALSYAKSLDEIYCVYQLAATMLAKQVHKQKEKQSSYQVRQITGYISRNIYNKITLESLANNLNLSPNYLSSLFSEAMGISIHNYIQREKVHIACNLLKSTVRPVSDIAAYMGFQTPSHFAVIFRKWMHMTPTEYRSAKHQDVF